MKKITRYLGEIKDNKDIRNELENARENGTLADYLKKADVSLSDEELELISGGRRGGMGNAGRQENSKEEPKKKIKKTTATATPKAKAPKATKKEQVTKEVTKQQNTAILEQVISNREVKYIYPEDVKDTLARKRWRQQTRNELHRLEREMYRIKDTNSKEYKAAKKAFDEFQAKVLKPAQSA